MKFGDIFVGDDGASRARCKPANEVSGIREEPSANQNRIGPLSQLHADLRLVRKGLRAGALLLIGNGNALWPCWRG